jgi:hypothetical protein
MKNEFTEACLAMAIGIGAGMLLSVIGQKMLNKHYQKTCNQPGYNLVLTRTLYGDAYYCINSKYVR